MSSRILRTYEVFYEAEGSYAVRADAAEQIAARSLDIVSGYTGRLALGAVRPVRLPFAGGISASRVRLGGAPHTLLVTHRMIDVADGTPPHVGGHSRTGRIPNGPVVQSRIVVSLGELRYGMTLDYGVGAGVHELGHAFYLDHCTETEKACIMPSHFSEAEVIVPEFAPGCAEKLEIAGYQELAAKL